MVYITINRTKWCYSKLLMRLIITIKTYFTFVMLLKWAVVIGHMSAKGRPFDSNDVIWLHQVTVLLYKETVPLFELNQIQSKLCDTKLHFIRNSQLIYVHYMRDRNPKPQIYGLRMRRCLPKEDWEVERFLLVLAHIVFSGTTCGQLVFI